MRREFPKAVKVAVIKRATRDGVTYCEGCGEIAKKWRIDHIRADGLLGEPVYENAQLLGPCCYAAKDAADTKAIAKAKRREAKHLGAVRAKGAIKSGGFSKTARTHAGRQGLPPRAMFIGETNE
jgi:hypothetical protein